jgi:hypothetical protein
MNILNYEAQEIGSLEEIIEKQKEIMFAFEPNLEKRVEEFDIDIYEDQMLLKEFLLERVVEEITEASIALRNHHIEHYKEEMIDVFNFLLETKIILGDKYSLHHSREDEKNYDRDNADTVNGYFFEGYEYWGDPELLNYGKHDDETIADLRNLLIPYLYRLIEAIGELTNLLKQRPWRESQYPVDLLTFKQRWQKIIDQFWDIQIAFGFNWEEFKAIWSKKYQVNKFRIESNY